MGTDRDDDVHGAGVPVGSLGYEAKTEIRLLTRYDFYLHEECRDDGPQRTFN